MEHDRERTGVEEVEPQGEAGVVPEVRASPSRKGYVQGQSLRTSSRFLRKRKNMWRSKTFLAGLATAAVLVAGVTVMVLQNRDRVRSRITSESAGRTTPPASRRATLDSRCKAIFAAQEARFFAGEEDGGDTHTWGDGQARRRLAEGGGSENPTLAEGTSEENLQCVVRKALTDSARSRG